MRIAIIHNAVNDDALPDDRDVLVQVQAVTAALKELGHEPISLPCTLDLHRIRCQLQEVRPNLVFNLVESLEGYGSLIHLFPSLLDAMNLPYTGAKAASMMLTSNKIMAKERMIAHRLPTPLWIGPFPNDPLFNSDSRVSISPESERWLIKSVWEHASVGLKDDELITGKNVSEIETLLRGRAPHMGGACFAEAYIEGREFNISVLAGPEGPEVLPVPEIVFEGYPDSKPKIVGYRAKWHPDSYEYQNTYRRFEFPSQDRPLLNRLEQTALKCWQVFGLTGYARMDFRVSSDNRLWILEVNANPCLSPDAGFAAALSQAGIPYSEAIKRIIEDRGQRIGGSEFPFVFRYEPEPEDSERVREMARQTGFFREDELDVAVELVHEYLQKGRASGYGFVFAQQGSRLIGYSCYGLIPCTVSSYDLYWIVVSPEAQGKGVGKRILKETERLIQASGGTRVYIETSNRLQYRGTCAFYEQCGYRVQSLLEDFYAPGDGKATYCKQF